MSFSHRDAYGTIRQPTDEKSRFSFIFEISRFYFDFAQQPARDDIDENASIMSEMTKGIILKKSKL